VSEPLLLGVDGGNTKTVALAARFDGTLVGAGRAHGSADIHAVAPEVAVAVVARAMAGALMEAGGAEGAVARYAFSMAGADWPEDVALLEERLGSRWPGCVVVNDAIGALRAAIPEGPGVVVVCGTGAATGARGHDGRLWHSSFWQEPQGAHELGVQALLAIIRAELGIDPPTGLTPAVLRAVNEPDVESVVHRWTRRDGAPRIDPAVLAPVLLDAADAGDEQAARLVRRQGEALGATALAAARRVGIDADVFALALAGGVFRHPGRLLVQSAVEAIERGGGRITLVRPDLEPAVGALLLAFDRAGIAVDAAVEARLRATLPPAHLYDTHPMTGGAPGG
jgi:N-acetylglucosamine kinase-like BadF-type ATPase